jgi:NAD(P)-dependent dehydrogenase (short-subunit alcohol dehydrogenase family)
MELEGRVVIVTGASRGIGAGIARRCLDEGACVLGVSRTAGPLEGEDRYRGLTMDLGADRAGAQVMPAALNAFGRVDALVNNAGVLHSAPCWQQSDEEWDAMVSLNVTAPFLLAQRFARYCRAAAHAGTVVNICSVESDVAWKSPPQAGYAASKGALLGLTRALALDLAEHHIRVVAIGPGVIDTGMATPQRAATERLIPLGHRFGTPEEIGEAVVFLLSARADYITGEIVYVDGGYRLR